MENTTKIRLECLDQAIRIVTSYDFIHSDGTRVSATVEDALKAAKVFENYILEE